MQCPVCRRVSTDNPSRCPRCDAELETLASVETASAHLYRRGVRLLHVSPLKALRILRGAERLRRTPATRKAVAAALLCAGNFAAALRVGASSEREDNTA